VARAGVVGVRPVADHVETEVAGRVEHPAEAHRPAVVAPVVVVGDEVGVVEFGEGDGLVPDADLVGDAAGVGQFLGREGLGAGGAGDGVVAEGVVGDGRDDGGVDAAGEGHEDAVARGEVLAGRVELGGGVGVEGHWVVRRAGAGKSPTGTARLGGK